ncbi:MAG TPA: sulfatase [Nocardioidaceae bacterium]|nr:sulfatase [Nocardioidaceae bacterium]
MQARRISVAIAALLAAPLVSVASTGDEAAAVDPPPNVVVILVDDARFDDMSTLPQVKALIGDAGATFANAYAPFPLCCPARATILTGQYAHNHGVLANEAPLGGFSAFEDTNTMATWLTPDYTTGFIGKYLNGYSLPYRPPGWDSWMVPTDSVYNYRGTSWNINGVHRTYAGYRTDAMGTIASEFIDAHADDARPFMLFTSIVAPHAGNPVEADDPNQIYNTSIFPTPNVKDTYRDRFAGLRNADPSFNEADVSDKPVRPGPLAQWEINALTEVNAQRREALLSAQDATRRIIESLQAAGELDNTYVLFLSDNGFMLGDHRIRSGKVHPYEVATRIPLMIRGPGIPAGSVVTQPVGEQDIAPTILAMTDNVGANGGFPLDGANILSMIGNPGVRAGRPVVIEMGPKTAMSTDYRFHGVVVRVDGVRWKYVERTGGRKELYDLNADPAELTNVAGKAAYTQIQSQLRTLLLQYQWCAGTACL